MSQAQPPAEPDSINLPSLAVRGGIGGVLMGLANLVPGISGGTMLLAAGVYPRFIEAIGEVTTLRFRRASMVVLTSVVVAALLAIVLLAGVVKTLVIDHRWVMYALFIGLTLGGVPVVWRLIKRPTQKELPEHDKDKPFSRAMMPVWLGATAGFVVMAALAVLQSSGATGDANRDGFIFLLLAGIAGASAMILPGVSGGYLLLVLGVYVPILAGIDAFKNGLKAKDSAIIMDVGTSVILPVGLGVLLGGVVVSNLLRWLLNRYERATLGVLLGLLVGAVVGLWPFQQTVEPTQGQLIKGREVAYGDVIASDAPENKPAWYYVDSATHVDEEDFPIGYFTPSAVQVGGALGLILLGLTLTLGVDRLQSLGKAKESSS